MTKTLLSIYDFEGLSADQGYYIQYLLGDEGPIDSELIKGVKRNFGLSSSGMAIGPFVEETEMHRFLVEMAAEAGAKAAYSLSLKIFNNLCDKHTDLEGLKQALYDHSEVIEIPKSSAGIFDRLFH